VALWRLAGLGELTEGEWRRGGSCMATNADRSRCVQILTAHFLSESVKAHSHCSNSFPKCRHESKIEIETGLNSPRQRTGVAGNSFFLEKSPSHVSKR
jgi:hypothetical protein